MTGEDREQAADFGYREVPREDKPRLVQAVFDSVADRYDLMNDLMSAGLHRGWKRFAAELAGVAPGQRVLDLAAGTGDLAALLAQRVGSEGFVTLADLNEAMLRRGRERLADEGIAGNVGFVRADAERLPFPSGAFDCVTIGFGLRNLTDRQAGLAELYRVLRPGGRALVLEFSRPATPGLEPLYDWYSFTVLPRLGHWVAGDADSYRYLAESIRRHPDQETLRGMMEQAGFARCQYFNLAGGIVAVHRGYRT